MVFGFTVTIEGTGPDREFCFESISVPPMTWRVLVSTYGYSEEDSDETCIADMVNRGMNTMGTGFGPFPEHHFIG